MSPEVSHQLEEQLLQGINADITRIVDERAHILDEATPKLELDGGLEVLESRLGLLCAEFKTGLTRHYRHTAAGRAVGRLVRGAALPVVYAPQPDDEPCIPETLQTPLMCETGRTDIQDSLGITHMVRHGWVFELRHFPRYRGRIHQRLIAPDFSEAEVRLYTAAVTSDQRPALSLMYAVHERPYEYRDQAECDRENAALQQELGESPRGWVHMPRGSAEYTAGQQWIRASLDWRRAHRGEYDTTQLSHIESFTNGERDDYLRMIGKEAPYKVLDLLQRGLEELRGENV